MLKSCLPFRILFSSCLCRNKPAKPASSEESEATAETMVDKLIDSIVAVYQNPSFPTALELPQETMESHLHHLRYILAEEFEAAPANEKTIKSYPLTMTDQYSGNAGAEGSNFGFIHVTAAKTIHIIISGLVLMQEEDKKKDFDSSMSWIGGVAVHNGFHCQAQKMMPVIAKVLAQICKDFGNLNGHQIILGGHSFAAAVASILTYMMVKDESLNMGDAENQRNRFKFIGTGVPQAFIHSAESQFDLSPSNFVLFQNAQDTIVGIPEKALVVPAHPDKVFNYAHIGTIVEVVFDKDDLKHHKSLKNGLKHSFTVLLKGKNGRGKSDKWEWLRIAASSPYHNRLVYLKHCPQALLTFQSKEKSN